jgi:hypothetical protein
MEYTSESSSISKIPATISKTFTITTETTNKNLITITPESSINNPTPTYTVFKSSHGLTLFTSSQETQIGTAVFHRFSSFNTDLILESLPKEKIKIHPSTTTYGHEFFHPMFGAMRWAPRNGKKGRGKDLELRFLRGGEAIAVLEAPKEVGKGKEGQGTRLLVSLEGVKGIKGGDVDVNDLEVLVVFSAIAIGVRGHGKADVVGAAAGFGAVGW